MTRSTDLIEYVEFDNAFEFLAYLRLANDRWVHGLGVPWIFRGQGNATWPLLAKAWRESTLKNELRELCEVCRPFAYHQAKRLLNRELKLSGWYSKVYDSPLETIADILLQLALEYGALRDFLALGDELGFPVGELGFYPSALGYLASKDLGFGGLSWPTYVWSPEAGLAQHHGIPTRLLDWTRKPEIAAYFAASTAAGERLAVWALNVNLLPASADPEMESSGVRLVTCPRYKHTYLHAQDALFTFIEGADRYYLDKSAWPTLEEYLKNSDAEFDTPPLRQVTLPSKEADALVELLWRERVSKAHLMPTYDNIAAALSVKWRLETVQIEKIAAEADHCEHP